MIAALYVETGGVYSDLLLVDAWDEARDARLYDGPWPVVAHPPCARWCRFAPGIETRYGYRVGDDGGCFKAALDAVRRFGGVLEHPAGSLAWDAFGLPKPTSSQGWTTAMDDSGAACYVEQGRYGHPMRKATWLYAHGVALPTLRWGRRPDSELGALNGAAVTTSRHKTATVRVAIASTRRRQRTSATCSSIWRARRRRLPARARDVSERVYSDVACAGVLVYCEDDHDVVLHRRDLEYRAACSCGWRAEVWLSERAPAEEQGYDHAMTHAVV